MSECTCEILSFSDVYFNQCVCMLSYPVHDNDWIGECWFMLESLDRYVQLRTDHAHMDPDIDHCLQEHTLELKICLILYYPHTRKLMDLEAQSNLLYFYCLTFYQFGTRLLQPAIFRFCWLSHLQRYGVLIIDISLHRLAST